LPPLRWCFHISFSFHTPRFDYDMPPCRHALLYYAAILLITIAWCHYAIISLSLFVTLLIAAMIRCCCHAFRYLFRHFIDICRFRFRFHAASCLHATLLPVAAYFEIIAYATEAAVSIRRLFARAYFSLPLWWCYAAFDCCWCLFQTLFADACLLPLFFFCYAMPPYCFRHCLRRLITRLRFRFSRLLRCYAYLSWFIFIDIISLLPHWCFHYYAHDILFSSDGHYL